MLKRIYIDNYKCLVNLELSVGPINLFLGPNGGGKSTVFEVLWKLRSIMTSLERVSDEFKYASRTRWQTSPIQTFELEIVRDLGSYRYELALEYDPKDQKAHIKYEHLWLDNNPLISVEKGEAHIFRTDLTQDRGFISPDLSAIGPNLPLFDPRIDEFKQYIRRLLIVQVNPAYSGDASNSEESYPSRWLDNYASWYRYLSRDQGWAFELTKTLQEVLPGFEHFKFVEEVEQFSILMTIFSNLEGDRALKEYRFGELSDGQRVLIALYTLLTAARKEKYTLCIDEPENYLALPEIRPWMVDLYDLCNEDKMQAILISHHPESIDYLLASPVGYWFERQNNLSTRVKPIRADNNGGLPISDLIARGWLND